MIEINFHCADRAKATVKLYYSARSLNLKTNKNIHEER